MSFFKRKQYIIDKKLQFKISTKAVVLSLITVFILGCVLMFFAVKNSNYINTIVKTQDQMIDMFLTTPALMNSQNPTIQSAESTFKNNIGMLVEIRRNSEIVIYFIIFMIIIQSVIIFAIFIFITHRITGPIYVMTKYLQEIREGKTPVTRPLRQKDELKGFHEELRATIDYLLKKRKE
jgi:nitrogen fixation/metabolism regulation signal transduction histidine kinase